MQFDTYTYALFLPLVFFIYWGLRRHLKWQNLFLLVASYVFYGWWDWKMLGLIVLTSVSTFGTALMMRGDRARHDRSWAAANIVLNLGILAVFKYLNFMRDSFVHLLGLFGVNPDWPTATPSTCIAAMSSPRAMRWPSACSSPFSRSWWLAPSSGRPTCCPSS